MFERLVWQKDRMLLEDLVFRLEQCKEDQWEHGEECLRFYKIKELMDQYEAFFSLREDYHCSNMFEIGIWDGGSVVLWNEVLRPKKLVAIDLASRGDGDYFKKYIQARNVADIVKTYWTTNQADRVRLLEIANQEFDSPIDLVIDDGSHLYVPTKASFETLFPLIRPGGLYIIEDWAWAHWREFQSPDHEWANETPLTNFIFELVEAIGTSLGLIASVTVKQGFTVVERGQTAELMPALFRLDEFISRRPSVPLSDRMWRNYRQLGHSVRRARMAVQRQLDRHLLWRFH